MKKKHGLTFWFIMAVLLSFASFLTVKIDHYIYRNYSPIKIGEKLIPFLSIDRITEIQITKPDIRSISLNKEGGSWIVPGLYN